MAKVEFREMKKQSSGDNKRDFISECLLLFVCKGSQISPWILVQLSSGISWLTKINCKIKLYLNTKWMLSCYNQDICLSCLLTFGIKPKCCILLPINFNINIFSSLFSIVTETFLYSVFFRCSVVHSLSHRNLEQQARWMINKIRVLWAAPCDRCLQRHRRTVSPVKKLLFFCNLRIDLQQQSNSAISKSNHL